MEMLVPHVKRLVDYAHSLGMRYEFHSCGKNEALVPCYLATGADIWAPQEQNDVSRILEEVKGEMMIGLWGNDPDADAGTAYREGSEFGRRYSQDYRTRPVYHCDLFNINEKWRRCV